MWSAFRDKSEILGGYQRVRDRALSPSIGGSQTRDWPQRRERKASEGDRQTSPDWRGYRDLSGVLRSIERQLLLVSPIKVIRVTSRFRIGHLVLRNELKSEVKFGRNLLSENSIGAGILPPPLGA